MDRQNQTAGETATTNQFVEEGKRKAEKVRKALEEGRVSRFRWAKDGSCCEFYYSGIDNHGLPCTFMSDLNRENSLFVFGGIYIYPYNKKEGGEQ